MNIAMWLLSAAVVVQSVALVVVTARLRAANRHARIAFKMAAAAARRDAWVTDIAGEPTAELDYVDIYENWRRWRGAALRVLWPAMGAAGRRRAGGTEPARRPRP